MRSNINPTFADRADTARAAKQAILAKFKPKPTVQATEFVDRQALRAQKAAEMRAKRDEEKAAKEHAKLMAKAAEIQSRLDNESEQDEAKRAERKARKAAAKADARERREAKSAARR